MKPRSITLHPGDVACVDRGDRLETLLGSCVSILLTDPRRTLGAMCHVVHAGHPPPERPADTAYGEAALAHLGRCLRRRGIDPRQCQAWVYGGGNMFPDRIGDAPEQGNIGAVNALWAMQAVQAAGIEVLGASVGGHAYRKLRWTVGPDAPVVDAVALAHFGPKHQQPVSPP